MEIALVLSLLLVAVVLFASEKISVDVVTVSLLIVLILSGILTPAEAFEGFSSDFVILLAAIFVITAAIEKSGILETLIGRLLAVKKVSTRFIQFYIMLFTSVVGAFMNNTTITAMMVNPVIGLARKTNVSPSKLLMPLAFASIVGGNCTLIGTSTNVAVSSYMVKAGMPALGMFEITQVGIITTLFFMVYMLTLGYKLLPDHKPSELRESYGLRDYLSEIIILPESSLIGQRVFASDLAKLDFRILAILRNGHQLIPNSQTYVQENDLLLIEGKIEELLKVKEIRGMEIKADTLDFYSSREELRLGEVMVAARSELIGRTVHSSNFRQRYGLVVMAVHRAGQTFREKIRDIRLQVGDMLLVQGTEQRFQLLQDDGNLITLDQFQPPVAPRRKGILTIAFFSLAVVLGSLNVMPLAVAFVAAAVVTILIKAMPADRAYSSIDWRLLILIAGMSAFGTAMKKTGADLYVSSLIVDLFKPLGVHGILAGFILLTVLLTQPLSNAAAALVVLPIALQTAHQLGVSERTFAIAIMMSASVSLITPFEPACILVYGPGKYRFLDFLKVGGGITFILMILLWILVPYFWPL